MKTWLRSSAPWVRKSVCCDLKKQVRNCEKYVIMSDRKIVERVETFAGAAGCTEKTQKRFTWYFLFFLVIVAIYSFLNSAYFTVTTIEVAGNKYFTERRSSASVI